LAAETGRIIGREKGKLRIKKWVIARGDDVENTLLGIPGLKKKKGGPGIHVTAKSLRRKHNEEN